MFLWHSNWLSSKNKLLHVVQLFFSITIDDMDKTDKFRHIANMYFTVNSSSLNLACARKRNFHKFHGDCATSAMLLHRCCKTYRTDFVNSTRVWNLYSGQKVKNRRINLKMVPPATCSVSP